MYWQTVSVVCGSVVLIKSGKIEKLIYLKSNSKVRLEKLYRKQEDLDRELGYSLKHVQFSAISL